MACHVRSVLLLISFQTLLLRVFLTHYFFFVRKIHASNLLHPVRKKRVRIILRLLCAVLVFYAHMNPSELHSIIKTWERNLAQAEDRGWHNEAEQIRHLLIALNYCFSTL